MNSATRPRRIAKLLLTAILLSSIAVSAHASNDRSCSASDLALQVLGSGGPIADDARASAGYLVWVDGQSRFLIDAGGGVILRFAESAASFASLDFVGISHFHADHSADLPALLKSGYFANRERPLPIAGPAGSGPFPGLNHYLDSLIGSDSGAYGYLSGYLGGTGGLPRLIQTEVELDQSSVVTVLSGGNKNVHVDALPVPHGIVPSLAFRLQIGDSRLVFASDQNGSNDEFIQFARDATILVMHMPVPEDAGGVARNLHAPPSIIGKIAADANVKTLVLSHFMARSLRELDKNVAIIRQYFKGRVLTANDLDCISASG